MMDEGGAEIASKGAGAVETATFTVSAALDKLKVKWPHARGTLMEARRMSDTRRTVALKRAPDGKVLEPSDVVTYAERAPFALTPRTVVEFPSRRAKPPRGTAPVAALPGPLRARSRGCKRPRPRHVQQPLHQ